MRNELFNSVKANTTKLLEILASARTESVVGHCVAMFMPGTFNEVTERSGLSAPMKQCLHLLALMSQTAEGTQDLDGDDWDRVHSLLNSLRDQYSLMFFPDDKELPDRASDWWQHCQVAMPAFLKYFFEIDLLSREQAIEKALALFVDFDRYIKSETGLTVAEAISVADKIHTVMQTCMDNFMTASNELSELLKVEPEVDPEENEQAMAISLRLSSSLSSLFKISYADLEDAVGSEMAQAYWALFVLRRGENDTGYQWITEKNPVETAPLFEIEDGKAMCFVANLLYTAIIERFSQILLSSSHRESFLRSRDKLLEQNALQHFQKYFGDGAEYYVGVYETPTAQKEHDLVIKYDSKLLVVECKASPAVEPFRDPERAFTRIKSRFKEVIQKAFDQAHSLKTLIESRESVKLYDKKGMHILTVKQVDIAKVYCICLTEANFGMLATDLSMLLEKDSGEPYPWAANIYDLEVLFAGFSHAGLGPDRFVDYLSQRHALHGKAITADELDIAGCYLRQGTLADLIDRSEVQFLTDDWGQVFDDIWLEKNGGQKADLTKVEKPAVFDVQKELFQKQTSTQKIGRNEKCPWALARSSNVAVGARLRLCVYECLLVSNACL